jgi:hypothetical protein
MPGFLTRVALLAAALGLFTSAAGPAIAQTFPNRTVKLIVAVPAGGVRHGPDRCPAIGRSMGPDGRG